MKNTVNLNTYDAINHLEPLRGCNLPGWSYNRYEIFLQDEEGRHGQCACQ